MKMLAAAIAVIAILTAGSAHALTAEDYYNELVEWVFKPCIDVGSALGADELDQESVELGIKREHIAQIMLAERHNAISELAVTFANGKKNPTWEERRKVYPPILRMCLGPFLNK